MAMLRGLRDQLLASRLMRKGEVSVVEADGVMPDGDEEIGDFCPNLTTQDVSTPSTIGASASCERDVDSFALRFGIQNDRFVDANTGLPPDEDFCRAARKKDIDNFKSRNVWEIRTYNEAQARMGRALCPSDGWRSTKATT